ncbi:nucleoside diphosphate kinase homolog 5-like [Bradysia coprophila]|uniref:nucleoside diphosphate kinase homolog 5-like n=1 Tax=Bradysia coprophila TaxID=38358 RepID=UPI00187DD3CD|nr:nucleoside diphosphate kinase homolog 5-like [Bradysia coprophila]
MQSIEQTLAIIKPSGMQYREEILQKLFKAHFKIIDTKICKLSAGQVCELFKIDWSNDCYAKLAEEMTSGPIQAMCLAKPNAIKSFLALFGLEKGGERKIWPCNVKSCFGSIENDISNGLHGSESSDCARWEIQFFFPDIIVTPILTSVDDQRNYLHSYVYPKLFDGLYEIAKKRPHEPIIELAHWLSNNNNPNKPAILKSDD